MYCSNCGEEVGQDVAYCPKCGVEVQLVPEFLDLDDLIQEEEKAKPRKKSAPRPNQGQHLQEEKTKMKKQSVKQKNRILLIQIIGLSLFIVAAVTFAIVFMSMQKKNTDDYQIKQAKEALEEKDYKAALEYYKKARELNSKNLDVVKGIASCYDELGDMESAALYYLEVAEAEPNNEEVFKRLLEIYWELGDQESIDSLYSSAQTQSIKDLFASYLLAEPQFGIEEGTYNEFMDLTITLAEPGEIYYTLDGSKATQESTRYEAPISLQEGKTVVHAIAVTQSGKVSDEVVKTYEIVLETPKAPGISPESGKFSEATRIELTIPEGATAYYTTDGSVPTEKSKTCGTSLSMPIGNNIISVMYIDKNKKMSEVVKRNYNLSMSLPVGQDVAEDAIKTAMLQKGIIDNMDGYKEGADGVFEFKVLSLDTIYGEDYFIMERTKKYFSGEEEFVDYYAYKISDGKLYKASLSETGSYKLSAF